MGEESRSEGKPACSNLSDYGMKTPTSLEGYEDPCIVSDDIRIPNLSKGGNYRVEYRDVRTHSLVYAYETNGVVLEAERHADAETQSIFDIVTVFETEKFSENTNERPNVRAARGQISMHIKSEAIINALRSVVDYYPGQDLSSDTITLPAPYAILVHHKEKLHQFGDEENPANSAQELCVREKDAYHDIKVMQDFLEENFMTQVRLKPGDTLSDVDVPEVWVTSKDHGWISDCTCRVCEKRMEENSDKRRQLRFANYNGIHPEDEKKLSSHQKYLLPWKTWGFVFKTRTWGHLNFSCCSKPQFKQSMIDRVVIKQEWRQTLKALSSNYIRKDKGGNLSEFPTWSADFVVGKGQGLIILLHGKPGVGKTYTAECIAEYTERPLMVLTSSDIGTDPDTVEQVLMDHFKDASRWGAVLLIDEADVFMERRSTNDLTRNSLVAGFLRALEFYDGILFLTTNRVGAFDDAFISRIHVQFYYPDFDEDDRKKVWQAFIEKLGSERAKTTRVTLDFKEYIEGSQIKEVKWNGREIRNAFQTAVALAEYEADKDEEGKIKLKDTHLRSIVEMSRDFKSYLDRLHQGNEDKRAAREFTILEI